MTKTISSRVIEDNLQIFSYYNNFIIDLWGVIHDGTHLYPNVIETLEWFKKSNKRVFFLTNAPRKASSIMQLLTSLGINQDLYEAIISSGEVMREIIKANIQDNTHHIAENGKYILFGETIGGDLLDDFKLEQVSSYTAANFIMGVGYADDLTSAEIENTLNQCQKKKLPMICVNPDLKTYNTITNEFELCAGSLAQEYEALGGEVYYIGKPHKEVYNHLFSKYNIDDLENTLVIGDNYETDILGANNQELASLLIGSGVHHKELGVVNEQPISIERVIEVSELYQSTPSYISKYFGLTPNKPSQ